jgi:hypothetical protein
MLRSSLLCPKHKSTEDTEVYDLVAFHKYFEIFRKMENTGDYAEDTPTGMTQES